MNYSKLYYQLITIIVILFLYLSTSLADNAENSNISECKAEYGDTSCHNNKEAQKLKLIAIPTIFVSSAIGVCLPLFTSGKVRALRPDGDMFIIIKALSAGVILATGFVHVLPDSFNDLNSKCLPEKPWRKFPFTTFCAMVTAMLTLMADSYYMSTHKKSENGSNFVNDKQDVVETIENGSDVVVMKQDDVRDKASQLRRNKVIAMVLEVGIIVHSSVISIAMGATDNKCSIHPLIAALSFHQFFEGMGLGGCISQAEYGSKKVLIMVCFFSVTTPCGIGLGMGIQKIYSETSPAALIVVGLLNACAAGVLIYTALVDLLAHDFLGPKLQSNKKLSTLAFVAVFIGMGGMSLTAKWA